MLKTVQGQDQDLKKMVLRQDHSYGLHHWYKYHKKFQVQV